jgi:hypothetical protein
MAKRGRRFKWIRNCIPSRDTETDWRIEHAVEGGLLAAAPPIPPTKDLRESWWTVGNQEETGSCVGWATADGVLRWHFVKAGRLGQKELLATRFIWMASKETDEYTTQPTTFIELAGTSLKSALDVARKFGAVPDSVLPFKSGRLFPGKPAAFYVIAAQRKIAAYINLGQNVSDWRTWIATSGPILTRLDCDDTWMDATDTNGMLDVYRADTADGGHAVAMVGYTKDRLIIRNSWGTDWGDKGFAYASFEYAKAAFTEAYGVTV